MVTRRTFLVASAAIVAAPAGSAVPRSMQAKATCYGAVYGRVGAAGILSGTSFAPSRGEVILLDGTLLQASHVSSDIHPNRSVLLSANPNGEWSVLYAEF